jgi:hypothetical protein
MRFRKERIPEIERGSTRSHSVENSLWKRLRTCRKADCGLNDLTYMILEGFP